MRKRFLDLVAALLLLSLALAMSGVSVAQASRDELSGGRPDLVVNGRQVYLDPRPYRVDVPGGQRTMVPFRSVAEALEYRGVPVMVDWWQERGPGGTLRTYVAAGNRHSEVLLRIGHPVMRRWGPDNDGGMVELEPVTLDAAPELRDGRTYLPLRAVVEGLGGIIWGHSPSIEISYEDGPLPADHQAAEEIAPGASEAHKVGLITLPELYHLADVQVFRAEQMALGNPQWAYEIPQAYLRFAAVKESIIQGRPLALADYDGIGAQSSAILGRRYTAEEVQELARAGERAGDILAKQNKWSEAGYDPVTDEWVDFSGYNELKRLQPNTNGPDRMFVVRDANRRIIMYIPVESKATFRPWVSPSRFTENVPLLDQARNLSRWSNPVVSRPFSVVLRSLTEQFRLAWRGEIPWSQVTELWNPLRISYSPKGGSSPAARAQMEAENQSYAAMSSRGTMTGSRLPKAALPPKSER